MAKAVRQVLLEAIEAGGSSLRDYVQSNGELGNFQRNFRVYDRAGEPCVGCGRPVSVSSRARGPPSSAAPPGLTGAPMPLDDSDGPG